MQDILAIVAVFGPRISLTQGTKSCAFNLYPSSFIRRCNA